MDYNTNDCGHIGGWSIDEDKNKEKVIESIVLIGVQD